MGVDVAATRSVHISVGRRRPFVRGAHGWHRCMLGQERRRGRVTAEWPIRVGVRRLEPCVWGAHRRHRCLLGQQQPRAGVTAEWPIRVGVGRPQALVWGAHGRHRYVLGRRRSPPPGVAAAGAGSQHFPSAMASAEALRVGCARTAPLRAGATTITGRRHRRVADSRRCPPVGNMRVVCAPTAPLSAGATTTTGRPTRRRFRDVLSA